MYSIEDWREHVYEVWSYVNDRDTIGTPLQEIQEPILDAQPNLTRLHDWRIASRTEMNHLYNTVASQIDPGDKYD